MILSPDFGASVRALARDALLAALTLKARLDDVRPNLAANLAGRLPTAATFALFLTLPRADLAARLTFRTELLLICKL